MISVPALFELPQSAATSEAAKLAGFDRVELLQEPVASAIAAGWTDSDDGAWLVYDLGERGGASLVLCEHPPTITVGRSGSTSDRVVLVTARPRSLPDLTCSAQVGMLSNITCTCPEIRSVSAGAPPR